MLTDKFTLIELFYLSLRLPEVGAVNFNILHAALIHMAKALGIEQEKVHCNIHDETAAQLAITKQRLSDPTIKGSTTSAQGIKEKMEELLKSKRKDQPKNEQEGRPGESGSEQEGWSEEKDQSESGQEERSVKKEQPESEEEGKPGEEGRTEEKDQSESGQEGRSDKEDQVKVKQEQLSDDEDGETTADDSKQPTSEELEDESEQKVEGQDSEMGVQDMFRAININRRVDGVEKELHELTIIVDMMAVKLNELETESAETKDRTTKLVDELDNSNKKIQKLEEDIASVNKSINDSSEQGKNEIQKLEGAFNEELGKIKDDISTNVNDINEKMTEIQDSITSREDFTELVSRVDTLEEVKVNREELGRLMEEGFIEKFIQEQESLRTDLDALKQGVTEVDDNVKALVKRIDEEIMQYIDDSLEEVNTTIETIKEKLDRLDADDINDTFARLEDQAEKTIKYLENLKAAESRLDKEARVNFKKISDLSDSLNRLETSKIDKSKMYQLLEAKADFETVMSKLDRSEFVSVMQDVEEKVEGLTNRGQTFERSLGDGLDSVRDALSFKMYTEDFVTATQPIRNHIKAMMYEQEKIKELVLTRFLPDAPGVTKCFSCKRAANLTGGKKYQGKYNCAYPSESHDDASNATQKKSERIKFPPIDLNSVPIPPADKPRTQDIHKLPVLFATARPKVGLVHHKRKKDIDKELSDYFGGENNTRTFGGGHTKTFPQQRGLSFSTKTLSIEQREEVLLKGLDNRLYKGSVPKNVQSDSSNNDEDDSPKDDSNNSAEQPSSESQKIVYPTPVVLHNSGAQIHSKKFVSLPVPK